MSLCQLFNTISESVWDEISENHARGNRFSEEGVTRASIIGKIQSHITKNQVNNIFAQKSIDEVNRGADLEIYIEHEPTKYIRYLLQAKLLEPEGHYKELDRFAGSSQKRQYDVLDSFAKQSKSMSFYLMYNGFEGYKYSGTDCAGNHDERQFGCTIIKTGVIKKHCESNNTGKLNFALSKKPVGLPWRFLTCCKSGTQGNIRLYTPDQIDMDPYFNTLFGRTTHDYKLPDPKTKVEKENESIHKQGWKPAGRIVISKKTKNHNT